MNKKPTITATAIAFIAKNPGLTCAQIGAGLGIKRADYGYPTLSSILADAVKRGKLRREKADSPFISGVKAWRYYTPA